MTMQGTDYEYAPFGDKLVRRKDAEHEWEEVPEAEHMAAVREYTSLQMEAAARSREDVAAVTIIRSKENEQLAKDLGLPSADRLAEVLTSETDDSSSVGKPSAQELKRLGMTEKEFRDRASGKQSG